MAQCPDVTSTPLTASSLLLFDCPPPEGTRGKVPSIITGQFYLLVVDAVFAS